MVRRWSKKSWGFRRSKIWNETRATLIDHKWWSFLDRSWTESSVQYKHRATVNVPGQQVLSTGWSISLFIRARGKSYKVMITVNMYLFWVKIHRYSTKLVIKELWITRLKSTKNIIFIHVFVTHLQLNLLSNQH